MSSLCSGIRTHLPPIPPPTAPSDPATQPTDHQYLHPDNHSPYPTTNIDNPTYDLCYWPTTATSTNRLAPWKTGSVIFYLVLLVFYSFSSPSCRFSSVVRPSSVILVDRSSFFCRHRVFPSVANITTPICSQCTSLSKSFFSNGCRVYWSLMTNGCCFLKT